MPLKIFLMNTFSSALLQLLIVVYLLQCKHRIITCLGKKKRDNLINIVRSQVKRCDEMARKLRFFTEQVSLYHARVLAYYSEERDSDCKQIHTALMLRLAFVFGRLRRPICQQEAGALLRILPWMNWSQSLKILNESSWKSMPTVTGSSAPLASLLSCSWFLKRLGSFLRRQWTQVRAS